MKVLTPYTCQYGQKTIFQLIDQDNKEVFRAIAIPSQNIVEEIKKTKSFLNPNETVQLEDLSIGERYSHSKEKIVAAGNVLQKVAEKALTKAKKVLQLEGITIQEKVPQTAQV